MALRWIGWDNGDVTVIALPGRITLGQGTTRLREALRQVFDRGRIHALTTIRAAGGQLRVAKRQSLMRDLLQVTRVYTSKSSPTTTAP